jgi:N-acetylglutamate synthase-like GNAT family acetyltransferase
MQGSGISWTEIINALNEIYREVDQASGGLFDFHSQRLLCRQGCTGCCMDGITVFEVEAQNIIEQCHDLLDHGVPYPEGACPFLDTEGRCRIYMQRPYVCRTQGLPLRWIDETKNGDIVEMRDICPVNDTGPAIVTLPEEQCWTIGPFELRLAALQALVSGNEMQRVPLRALFIHSAKENLRKDKMGHEASSLELDIEICKYTHGDEPDVIRLLTEAGLCTADLTPSILQNFLVARTEDGKIIGAVGCEAYKEYGLLRSLVIHPSYRGVGLGRGLTAEMETCAQEKGMKTLYLLTTTAADYFPRLGFRITQRSSVPKAITATGEFRNLCPATAVCMCKQLEP